MPDRNTAYAFEFTFNNKDNKLQLCTTSPETSKQWIDRLQETLKYYRNRYRIRQKMEHSKYHSTSYQGLIKRDQEFEFSSHSANSSVFQV
jgi:hypothetical protein